MRKQQTRQATKVWQISWADGRLKDGLDRMLQEGWEPFAVTTNKDDGHHLYHLRRLVTLASD
jgi:hypothetical protein